MNLILLYFLVASFFVVPQIAEGTYCNVIPFDSWATTPSRHQTELRRPVDLVVVTHTVTSECLSEQECVRIARAIRSNQQNQGTLDIGLSFLVGGNGKIYEGAGWKVGSHTRGYSERSISLSFIGDFRERLPTPAAIQAAENFLGCFLNTRYLDCEYTLVGHRQLIATISPGDALQGLIQSWPHWSINVSNNKKY